MHGLASCPITLAPHFNKASAGFSVLQEQPSFLLSGSQRPPARHVPAGPTHSFMFRGKGRRRHWVPGFSSSAKAEKKVFRSAYRVAGDRKVSTARRCEETVWETHLHHRHRRIILDPSDRNRNLWSFFHRSQDRQKPPEALIPELGGQGLSWCEFFLCCTCFSCKGTGADKVRRLEVCLEKLRRVNTTRETLGGHSQSRRKSRWSTCCRYSP